MNKYYILNLNPQAAHEWDRCVLRNPITGARPDFNEELAQAIAAEAGSYLVKVNLQIEILDQSVPPVCNAVELSAGKTNPIITQRLAS